MRRLLLVAALFLALPLAAAAAKVRWVPAKRAVPVFVAEFHSLMPGLRVQQAACMRPILPREWGAVVGIVQVDCILMAAAKYSTWCGEGASQHGVWSFQDAPCVDVALSFRRDVPAGAVVYFKGPLPA